MDLNSALSEGFTEDVVNDPTTKALVANLVGDHSVDYLEGYVTALRDTLAAHANDFMATASAEAMAVELLSLSLQAKKAAGEGEKDSKIYGD